MSKLDYVTIAIVAICIAAIIFLVVKTSRLMNDRVQPGVDPDQIGNTIQGQNEEEDDLFDNSQAAGANEESRPGPGNDQDPDDDEVQVYDPVGEEDRFGDETTSGGGSTSETEPPQAAPTVRETTPPGPQVRGEYMVLAGTFRYEQNAEQMVRKLKGLGYRNAEVGYTNNGAYAVALVAYFNDLGRARAMVRELETQHEIEAIIKETEKAN